MNDYKIFRPKNGRAFSLMIPADADFPSVEGANPDNWELVTTYSGKISALDQAQIDDKGYSLTKPSISFEETVVPNPQG